LTLPYGPHGTLLELDLISRKASKRQIDGRIHGKVFCGLGLNTWLIYHLTGPGINPLGHENVVLISPGLLTGTGAPSSSRVEVTTMSPLTGLIGTGNSGGHWGPQLKSAGYDSVLIKGVGEKPCHVVIDDGEISFHEADELWGLDTYETTEMLKRKLGERFSVMTIGPAGENLVRFAAPVFDKQHMPGRCHAGAVLGSKNLKAVSVRGSQLVRVRNADGFEVAVNECEERIRNYPAWKARAGAGSMGTIGITEDGIDYDKVVLPYLKRGGQGVYCPCMMESLYGCSLLANITEGPYTGVDVACAGLTLYSGTAAQYGISLPAAFHVNELCQRYGMDMFGPFFYAYDLYQRGIINEEETGLSLEWGDEASLMELLRIVAHREGFGDILAEGAYIAAQKLGSKAVRHVPTVKGLEVMRRDPRSARASNLFTMVSILTNPRGGDDLKGTHGLSNYPGRSSWARKLGIPEKEYADWLLEWLDMPDDFKKEVFGDPPDIEDPDQLLLTYWYNHLTSAYNSLGLCMFAASVADALGPTYQAKLYSSATGVETSGSDIMEAGERIFNLMRCYIVREGVRRKSDHWPDAFYEEPSFLNPVEGKPFNKEGIDKALTRYYELRGWDLKTGIPLEKTLAKLGVNELLAISPDL
jgi:aldehyde:ferredoxin oxidoreductase